MATACHHIRDTAAVLHQIDLNGAQQRQIKYINKNRKMHGNGMSYTKISLVSTAAALQSKYA